MSRNAHLHTMDEGLRIGAFARRAGVTVRALHHYDRLRLLRPARRSTRGYRLYADDDLVRLQQIVTLKALGFDLDRVAEILNAPGFDVRAALRAQIGILEDRRHRLDAALVALRYAESSAAHEQTDRGATHRHCDAAVRERPSDRARHVCVRDDVPEFQSGDRLPNVHGERCPLESKREIEATEAASEVGLDLRPRLDQQSVVARRCAPPGAHERRRDDRVGDGRDAQCDAHRRGDVDGSLFRRPDQRDVGIVKSAPPAGPAGQRTVVVLSLV